MGYFEGRGVNYILDIKETRLDVRRIDRMTLHEWTL